MIDFIIIPVRLALRLAGFAIVVVMLTTALFLSSARADHPVNKHDDRIYEFDTENVASMRGFYILMGWEFFVEPYPSFIYRQAVAVCGKKGVLVGVMGREGYKITPLCSTGEPLVEEEAKIKCLALGNVFQREIVLLSIKGNKFSCGAPGKMALDGEPQQDA